MSSSEVLKKQYQKKTDKEHILDNPDTYIGSVESIEDAGYVFENEKMKLENCTYIPGLYKLFDEAIVNCRDHSIRMKNSINNIQLTNIEVTVEDNMFSFKNDGNGIDVVKHPEYDIWIPEMIFAHLRTGTNYDKEEKRIVGGKNGFGAKLIFIWSTYGRLETVDHTRKLKFVQEYKNNLDEKTKPSITKYTGKPYTKISFIPDYKRLGISGLSPSMIKQFEKRTYDIAAVTDKSVKVKWNNSLIPVKTLSQYIDLYIEDGTKKIYEEGGERWSYGVIISPVDEFKQVSFVNGIYTSKGGKHVDYIMNQIIKKMCAFIQKKKKIDVKPTTIKEQIMLFLRCDIDNPAFDSQTKDYMNTPSSKFGSQCTVSDKFIEKLAKMGVMDSACALTEVKENKTAKKSDGSKSKSIRGIPKLVDANYSGTAKSSLCTIIFCEGDSAKAGIISGLTKDDRNYIGVYPMKGKLFNVRGESLKRINENKEIVEIKQILGLEVGKDYKSLEVLEKSLRYGKILFMTDQDLDGSHIKGLGINLFQSQWNSIAKLNVIGFMNTPILKAKKNSQELMFYNEGEYEQWKKEQVNESIQGWKIKYYKGLGTSTGKEFKEYFENKKIVTFEFSEKTDDTIDMIFNKKRSDDRKDWLEGYERQSFLDTNQQSITYEDFVNKEFIHFSKYDCERSIPNMMDGLKISLRKILFAAFKKKLTKEIKVAQFSGYVSEHSGYHHGEASLNGAIVGMAQNYVGSNNINLLLPNGQFGTRLNGGKDSASERYIFTELNPLTRYIYPEGDDNILNYLHDDGFPVEPIYYVPIIPMILVNGSKGIGTGFSTDIMCYNPLEIITILKNKLKKDDENCKDLLPYYKGFKGIISKIEKGKFLIKGCYNRLEKDNVKITELPIGSWTDDYKKYLEDLLENKKAGIKDYNDLSTDKTVDISIQFQKGVLDQLEKTIHDNGINGIEKLLKLTTTNSSNNMHMFDANEKLKLYKNAKDIIDDYYPVRLSYYQKRKDFIIEAIKKEMIYLSNRVKYIQENLDNTIDLRNKKKEEISRILKEKEYDIIDDDKDYKYLVKMPMDSVCSENIERLNSLHKNKKEELAKIENQTIEDSWLEDLDNLEIQYTKMYTV
jgi:DNA topoisomerase-2